MCLKIFGGAQNDFKETLLQGMAAVNSEQTIRGGVTGEEAAWEKEVKAAVYEGLLREIRDLR